MTLTLLAAAAIFMTVLFTAMFLYQGTRDEQFTMRGALVRRIGVSPARVAAPVRRPLAQRALPAILRGIAPLERFAVFVHQSGLPLGLPQFMMVMAGCLVAGTLAAHLWMPWDLSMIAGIGAALIPVGYANFARGHRLRRFAEQLPYLLDLLRSALESGHTLLRALQIAAPDLPQPMASEIGLVIEQVEVGASVPDALEAMYRREPDESLGFLAVAVRLQTQVGTGLAEVLQHVSESVRSRQRLTQQISALTAQTRLSAIIVSLLPVLILFFFSATRPQYVAPLFNDPTGIRLMKTAVVLNVSAFLIMRRIAKIRF